MSLIRVRAGQLRVGMRARDQFAYCRVLYTIRKITVLLPDRIDDPGILKIQGMSHEAWHTTSLFVVEPPSSPLAWLLDPLTWCEHKFYQARAAEEVDG